MSYILDALKKSEQQRQQTEVRVSDTQNTNESDILANSTSLTDQDIPVASNLTSRRYTGLLLVIVITCGAFVATILLQNLFERIEKYDAPLIEPAPRLSISDNGEPQFLVPPVNIQGNDSVVNIPTPTQESPEEDIQSEKSQLVSERIANTSKAKVIVNDPVSVDNKAVSLASPQEQRVANANTVVENTQDDVSSNESGTNDVASSKVTRDDQSIDDQNIAALLKSGSVILPSSKSQLTKAQQQEMIKKAVQGDVDLSTYADVEQLESESFTALTDDELLESNLSNIVTPVLVDSRTTTNKPELIASDSLGQGIRKPLQEDSLLPLNSNSVKSDKTNELVVDRQQPASQQLPSEQSASKKIQQAIAAQVKENSGLSKEISVIQPNLPTSPQPEPQVAVSQPRYKTDKAPLSVLAKIPNITVTGHLYSSSPDRRSVTFNRRVYDEGDTVSKDVVLVEITRSGFNLAVDDYLVPIKRGRGWRAVSAD